MTTKSRRSRPARVRLRFVSRLAFILLLAATGIVVGLCSAEAQAGPRVLVSSVDGAITPVIADHLQAGLDRASSGGFEAYLVELDTPGGLDASMRDIVQTFLGSEVPVVVYVAPKGARAASAGRPARAFPCRA